MVELDKQEFLRRLKSLLSTYDAELFIEDKQICFWVDGMEYGEYEPICEIKDNTTTSIGYLDIDSNL